MSTDNSVYDNDDELAMGFNDISDSLVDLDDNNHIQGKLSARRKIEILREQIELQKLLDDDTYLGL